ncbi:class I SAM-dependent methyltransferase [Pseudonocardia sp.]|uniref:class I SAM-dependent methyltransferase n=1 Tax=Pseudonocardia sp. TaxID=60912 RepID=UPI003D0ED849
METSDVAGTAERAARGTATDGTATAGTAAGGTAADGTAAAGTAADGTAADGTAADGTATAGTAAVGTATHEPAPRRPAARRWAELQRGRGLPREILAAAPADPWRHDARDFTAPDVPTDTPSRATALDLLGDGGTVIDSGTVAGGTVIDGGTAIDGGTVIDVGCGAGDAAFALTGAARHLTGVDRQQDMLDAFAADATARGIAYTTVRGSWPEIAPEAGRADVVVCHHVLHNVVDLPPFVRALSAAARRGVVVEMLTEHPMAWLDPLFARFHGLYRPPPATHDDAVAVLRELGITPEVVTWERARTPPHDAEWVTRRLCLGPERVAEVAGALAGLPPRTKRAATISWRV